MQGARQVVQATADRLVGRAAARRLAALLALAGLALGAQACREEEQNRPLVYDKGTYQGQADESLDQSRVDALRQRAGQQQM